MICHELSHDLTLSQLKRLCRLFTVVSSETWGWWWSSALEQLWTSPTFSQGSATSAVQCCTTVAPICMWNVLNVLTALEHPQQFLWAMVSTHVSAEAIDKVVLHVSIGEYVTCTPRIYCKRATEIVLLWCGLYLQETRLTVTHCTSWQKLSLIVAISCRIHFGEVEFARTLQRMDRKCDQDCAYCAGSRFANSRTDKHTCSTVV